MLNYIVIAIIMMLSLYKIIISKNLLKKIIALSLFQSAVIIFYITVAKLKYAKPPILACLDYKLCPGLYANPLPQVLMLTAIVVGVATLALAISLMIKIKQNFKSINQDELP